ncbi:hypothetical protein LEMLEM_LOCUS12410 [Lemmus lemmus]
MARVFTGISRNQDSPQNSSSMKHPT